MYTSSSSPKAQTSDFHPSDRAAKPFVYSVFSPTTSYFGTSLAAGMHWCITKRVNCSHRYCSGEYYRVLMTSIDDSYRHGHAAAILSAVKRPYRRASVHHQKMDPNSLPAQPPTAEPRSPKRSWCPGFSVAVISSATELRAISRAAVVDAL